MGRLARGGVVTRLAAVLAYVLGVAVVVGVCVVAYASVVAQFKAAGF